MTKRPTIGFLINDVVNTYQYTIWCGVDAGCREAGFDLTVFTGGELGSTDPVKAVRARVFELANAQNIQGLVIGAPAVGNHLSPDEVAAYCRAFAPLPVVTVGFEVPGVPTVLVNNVAGMEEAVEHLVSVHGRRRIGFIGGPPANSEAAARIGAYRRVLGRHGVQSAPGWEAVANFDLGQARQAMRAMLDAGLGLDAVVAANDAMALGALEALAERGIRVPDDIAVCGFDDILETHFCTPPMATVRQPIFDQGRLGVGMLAELLAGKVPADIRPVLPANYLPRKSCGCVSEELNQAFLTSADLAGSGAEHLAQELRQLVPPGLVSDVEPSLAAFELDLSQGTCTASLNLLEQGIGRTRQSGGELRDWQSFINAERRLVLAKIPSGDPRQLLAESLWHQKRVALGEAEVQSVAYQNVTLENKIREMNLLGSHFVNSFDVALLIRQMIEGLPRQGIGTCYLLLCDPEAPGAVPRLAMAMEGGRPLPLPPEGLRLDPGAIFPQTFVQTEQRRTLVVEPLFFNDVPLGFLAYELSPTRGMVFDALRTLISAAIQGARLVQQVRQRTEELEVAYSSLQNMSRQIQDILQNIEQGLFVIDLEGGIQSDCSRSVHALLGVDDVTKLSLREALRLSADQESDFLSWLSLVAAKHESLRWEKLIKLAPVHELEVARVGQEPRTLRLAFQKMSDSSHKLRKIMVMAIDETEARRVERIVQAERERHENEVRTILGLVNNLPEVIQSYLDDTEHRIESSRVAVDAMLGLARVARDGFPKATPFEPGPDTLARIFRDLHTIKGNSATYGFETISRVAHQAEDLLEALKPPLEQRATATLESLQAALGVLMQAFQDVVRVRSRLSASGDETVVRVPERKLAALRDAVVGLRRAVPEATLHGLIGAMEHLRDVPLAKVVDKYGKLLDRIAERLEKKVEFKASPADLEIAPQFFAPFDEAVMHILRNCVDHGLEKPADRVAAGKPAAGRIELSLVLEEQQIVLAVSDDGRGIDVDAVVRKAIEQDLVLATEAESMSESEKLELIFGSGVSTSGEVTDLSGRGVGMAAVRECVMAMGGQISVTSKLGRGTRIELRVPKV